MATIPLPADILFAQKASACVKAAGLDPRTMDIKKFRQLAAVIFTRAYQGIYKEYDGILSDPLNEDEQSQNAQKVIDGLFKKTNNHILLEITGKDIIEGNHRAIGILVGIIYSEGNRLWVEKLRRAEESNKQNLQIHPTSNNHHSDIVPSISKTNKIPKKKKKKVVSDDVIKNENDDKISWVLVNGRDKSPEKGCGDENNVDRKEYKPGDPELREKPTRRKRPNSAPTHRIVSWQAKACERLFRATGRYREAVDAHITEHGHGQIVEEIPLLKGNKTEGGTVMVSSPSKSMQSVDKDYKEHTTEPYTYDFRTGRKIPVSQYQEILDELAKQRKLEAIHNLKNVSDLDDSGENKDKNINHEQLVPPPPTRAEWPSKSTGQSVEKWMKRIMMERGIGDETSLDPNAQPRHYRAYSLLEKMDFVISVEHCYNCEHHNTTLRHDAQEYVRQANAIMKKLAQIAHGR